MGNTSLPDQLLPSGQSDDALQRLYVDTYAELRQMAHARLGRGARGPILDTTSLVNESYLRFVQGGRLNVTEREHFIRYAARIMRSVVVDFVRERQAQRRGGDLEQVTLTTQLSVAVDDGANEILQVHEALEQIAQFDARLVQVVELRYFAGMTDQEIANALGVTDRTVRRDWEKARVLLAEALS